MLDPRNVLVASSDESSGKMLASILKRLSMNVFSCSALKQAEEILSQQQCALIFCDEALSDGSFRELLTARKHQRDSRIVVAIRTGEWKEYLEAMRLGAFDVIRCPLRVAEVESIVSQAMQEHQIASHQMVA